MELKAKIKIGDVDSNVLTFRLYHVLLIVTYIPSVLLLLVCMVLVLIVNALLMGTHHIEFKVRPKTLVRDGGFQWCEACKSWHHPDNPTCKRLRRPDDN